MKTSKSFRFALARWTLLMCGWFVAGTLAAAEVNWRLAHYLQEEHFFASGWLPHWVDELERRSDGRIDITIYPNNSLLRLGAIAPGVRDGKAEIGFGPAPASPRLDLIELPFTVESASHGARVAMSLLEQGKLGDELRGLHTVLLQTNAPSIVHMKSKPVRVPGDLSGQRMRGATEYVRTLLASLGADPVAGYLAPQVFGALEAGAVDGTIWPYEAIRIFDLGRQARFHTEVPIFASVLGLFVSRSAYDRLPADLQQVVAEMSGLSTAVSAAHSWEQEEQRGKQRVIQLGNTVIVPDAGQLQAWRKAAAPLIEQRVAALNQDGFDAEAERGAILDLANRLRAGADEPVVKSSKDCPHCPAMVVVPAGTFTMGSPVDEPDRGDDEGPTRQVTFAAPYAIGRTEVTRGEFAAFVAATGHPLSNACLIWNGSQLAQVTGKSWRDPGYPQTDDHPMVCVSWRDAAAYARWLTEQTGHAYRLPSEAEWEYAARGGTQTPYAFPATAKACEYGNISDNRVVRDVPQWNTLDCDDGVGFGTAPVASYLPNGYGLYDTVGNVWEWVADCYADNYAGAPRDGTARGSAGSCGVALDRGGGFSNIFPGHLRAANRSRAPSPDVAVYSLGFRVARRVEP